MRRLVPNRTSNLGAVAEAYALRASVPRQGHRACGGDVDCLSVVLALTNGQGSATGVLYICSDSGRGQGDGCRA